MGNKKKALAQQNANVTVNVGEGQRQPNVSPSEQKMITIFEAAQKSESFHQKYLRELHSVYTTVIYMNIYQSKPNVTEFNLLFGIYR